MALLLVLVSACVNLSRAATVISVGLVAILSVWQLSQIDLGQRRRISKGQFAVVAAIAAIVVAGGWLLVREIGFGDAYKHWTDSVTSSPITAGILSMTRLSIASYQSLVGGGSVQTLLA